MYTPYSHQRCSQITGRDTYIGKLLLTADANTVPSPSTRLSLRVRTHQNELSDMTETKRSWSLQLAFFYSEFGNLLDISASRVGVGEEVYRPVRLHQRMMGGSYRNL